MADKAHGLAAVQVQEPTKDQRGAKADKRISLDNDENDEQLLDDDKSLSSEKSELAELMNGSLSDEDINCAETVADAPFAKTKLLEETVMKIIEAARYSESTSIDLSKKDLHIFPSTLLNLSHLEYIYLQGNEIVSLPDEFFKCFPHLRWLDLRNNALSRIPTLFLSSHTHLRNLLMEGNLLRGLPLELGLVKSLHGLNIAGNPLDFPPQEVIDKGTQYILQFLREVMEAKNQAKMADLGLNLSEEVPDGFEEISASSDDWNTTASMMDLAKRRERILKGKPEPNQHNTPEKNITIGVKSPELREPLDYLENREQQLSKLHKTGTLGGVVNSQMKQKKNAMTWKLNPYPRPPSLEYVTYKMNEKKQLARVKEMKERSEAIIQRQKDDALLKNWREDARMLQRKKYSQHMLPGRDYEEPGEKAPFCVEKELMKVLSKEESLKADLLREERLKKNRIISPASRQRIQEEKQQRIRELEKRIKDHMTKMVERRKQPKSTPQHEIEIARKELEIAEQLHNELLARQKDIDYRFKAYSADTALAVGKNKTDILK